MMPDLKTLIAVGTLLASIVGTGYVTQYRLGQQEAQLDGMKKQVTLLDEKMDERYHITIELRTEVATIRRILERSKEAAAKDQPR